MRPRAYRPDGARVLIIDPTTGEHVTSAGAGAGRYHVAHGRRLPTVNILRAAAELGCRRVFLTGPKPLTTSWLDEPCPGWRPTGHFYKLRDPCGRWESDRGAKVEIRRAAAWFGEGDYTPAQAREALASLHVLLQAKTAGAVGLMASPAATGQSLWAYGLREGQADEQTEPDVAALIRATSPQHREEVFGHCFDGCEAHRAAPRARAPELVYVDGVFMYAACVRELGVGPAELLESPEVAEAYFTEEPYRRARYDVTVTVPTDWAGPGLLPVKHDNGRNWHYPSAPGWSGRTWVDGCELHIAAKQGWGLVFHSMIAFVEDKRPADLFCERILAMRLIADGERSRPVESALISKALRSMFIRTVGAWHSLGRERTHVAAPGELLPESVTEWETRDDGSRVYTVATPLTGNAAAFVRPELSSQVWARARAKVTAKMLTRPTDELVAVWGDALYLAQDPGWTGTKPGEFRVKGRLDGPVSRPKSISELLKLRDRMGDDL